MLGRPPFETTNLKETYRCIREAKYSLPSSLMSSAKHLIASMLSRNPEDRPSLEEIIQHDFFTQVRLVLSLVLFDLCPELHFRLTIFFFFRTLGLHTGQASIKLLSHRARLPLVKSSEKLLQKGCCSSVWWQERKGQIPR